MTTSTADDQSLQDSMSAFAAKLEELLGGRGGNQVLGMVNAEPDFTEHPNVIIGAEDCSSTCWVMPDGE
jgi:hypothetical protein